MQFHGHTDRVDSEESKGWLVSKISMKNSSFSKINTAVILAAGMGIRLRNVIGLCPKGLLEIDGKTLIIRSLERLKKEGINRVIMVTGFQKTMYHKHLLPQASLPNIEFVHSSRFAETGSMHSLFVAKDVLQDDFLLLESDLLYESRALPSVLNYEGPDVVLASGKTGSNDEVFIYGKNDGNRPVKETSCNTSSGDITAISKQPRPHLEVQGELVGISKISQNLFQMMCTQHEENLTFPCNNHYEECISDVSSGQAVHFLRVDDLVWTEIDDQSHFDRAVKIIYPGIIQQENINRRQKNYLQKKP